MKTQDTPKTTSLRAFAIKVIPATNTKPTRVKLTETRSKTSKMLSFTHSEFNNAWEVAGEYLRSIGITDLFFANGGDNVDYLLTADFNTEFCAK